MKLFGTIEVDEDLVNKKYVDDGLSKNQKVFVAVYEQTSYADVKAAIDAHKVIVLDMPANNNQFCITFATYTNGGNALMYAIYKTGDRSTLMTATLTPENNWTVTHTDLQDKLVSGVNIKTINNIPLLGSGNIDIQGGGGGGTLLVKYGETTYDALKEAYETGMPAIADSDRDFTKYPANIYYEPINPPEVDGYKVTFLDSGGYTYYWRCIQTNGVVQWEEIKSERYVRLNETGKLTDLTTTNKSNLVSAINEVYEKSGEPFRVKQWGNNALNVEIPTCTEDIDNISIPKMVFTIDNVEGADYQIVGMLAYEVFDATSGGNRINCWPVCQFTGNGQKELSVRWMCSGTTRKTAKRINAWVLLKHR